MWNWFSKITRPAIAFAGLAAVPALSDGVKSLNEFAGLAFALKLPQVTKLCRSCELWSFFRHYESPAFFW